MKKFILLITLLIPLATFGQLKITERSDKKMPSWVGGLSEGHITSNGVGKTMDEAKDIAIKDIQKQIIESIALNIKSESTNKINQTSIGGGELGSFHEQFDSKFATQAAKLPFVKGISTNKIAGVYWEKREDKKRGLVEYGYSILYPYTKGEQTMLVREFVKLDSGMEKRLGNIENLIDNFTTTEQLDQAVGEIPILGNYFFDDVRLERTKAAKAALMRQYSYIKPIVAMVKKGQASSILTIGDKIITTTQKPIIKSNCATTINYKVDGDGILVDFNDEGCVDSEDNFIEVGYRFNGKVVKEQVFFDINSEKLQAKMQGDLRFEFIQTEVSDSLSGVVVTFDLAVNSIKADLEAVTFNISNVTEPIVVKGCDIDFDGAGVYKVTINNEKSYKSKLVKGELPFAKGTLYIRNSITGALQSFIFTNKYNTNL